MSTDKVARGTRVFTSLYQFVIGVDKDVSSFSLMLYGTMTDRLWETGWVKESTGEFQKANSFMEFLEKYLGVDVPWVYAKLKLSAPLDNTKDRYTAKAFDLFDQCVQDETGKTPKAWYEEKLRPAHTKIAIAQADPESGEYVSPKGGAPKGNRNAAKEKEETTPSNTRGCSAKKMNGCVDKPGILRRLARERPDLLERYERGELTANAAAIEAGFRKPPKPRPTTPLELLDYCGEVLKTDSRIGTLFALMNALSPAEHKAAKNWLKPNAA